MNTLLTIQQKLKAPKSQTNKFGGYNYRNCEDILEAVKPLLAETESTLTLDDDIAVHGPMVFVMATATLTDKEGKTWTASAFARHAEEQKGMMDSQLTGATSSYARKYALNGLFLIDDAKDADATNDGTKVAPKAKTPPPVKTVPKAPTKPSELDWLNPGTPNWAHSVKRINENNGVTVETIKKHFRLSKENETKLINETKTT